MKFRKPIYQRLKYTDIPAFGMLLVIALVSVITGCSNTEQYSVTADNFIDAYYVKDSVADAIVYSTGMAREQLASELPDSDAPKAADRPRVDISRLSSEREGSRMIFVYRIKPPQVDDLSAVLVTLTVESTDEGLRVSGFRQCG